MPELFDYIEFAKRLLEAARSDDGKNKSEILDGIEGHLENIEREAQQLDGNKWVVVCSADTGFAELANVNVTTAKTESEAIEKVKENVDRSINHGTLHANRVSDLPKHGEVWSHYR